MTVDELDTKLAKWQRDITAATSNLVAFEDNDSYKVAKTVLSHLEGKTKDAIGLPISALEQVWDLLGKLNEVIKQAGNLRQNLPLMFGRQAKIKQIEDLLIGPSICLQVKEIPLEERGLTGSSHLSKMTCPTDIFTVIQAKYLDAAKAAAQYEKVCQDLTQKLGEVETDLSVKFGGNSSQNLDDIKLLLHTDPITGLERLKKLKKVSPPKTVIFESPKAAETLYEFISKPEPPKTEGLLGFSCIAAIGDGLRGVTSIQLATPKAEDPKLAQMFNSNNNQPSVPLPVRKYERTHKTCEQLENLFGQPNKAPEEPEVASLETLIHGGGEKPSPKPSSQQLEDLFS